MEYRKLGQTDIEVSVMALGCWPFAGGTVWGEQGDAESIATVHAALNAGINFFDTAEGYENGHSERVLGRGLVGRRAEAVVATKVSPNHLTPEGIAAACEGSLKNLRTDYIDLYQIHWPNHDIPIETTWRVLEDLLAAGKVRALGVANFASRDLSDLLAAGEVAADQMPYSLLWRGIESEVLPLCRERDVGLVCYAPLAQGLLTGRYCSASEVPDGLARTRWYSGERALAKHGEPGCEEAVFAAIADIRTISERVGVPLASVSLAWVLRQRGVTSVLVGARNAEELGWNLPALDLAVDDEIAAELERVTEPVKQLLGLNLDMWFAASRMR